MPIAGFQRFRRHLVGKQTAFSSNVPATRQLPYRGALVLDPARNLPDVDVGSLDPILAPYNGASQYTGTWEGPLAYNDAQILWAATLKGGVTPTGSATGRIWTFQAASLTADDFEYLTDYWGDDQTTDEYIFGSEVINQLQLSFDADLGAFQVNADLLAGRARIGEGPTGGITIDNSPNWVYGADTEVYLDSVYTSIGTTKLTDAIHSLSLTVNNNLDQKRFANGSNTRFQLAGFGRGEREITLELVVAKTTATIAERATIDDTPVPDRFIEIRTTSPEVITGGSTPFSQTVRMPMRLMSATDGELGNNNTTITLTYRAFYSSDLLYAIRAVVTNELATLTV